MTSKTAAETIDAAAPDLEKDLAALRADFARVKDDIGRITQALGQRVGAKVDGAVEEAAVMGRAGIDTVEAKIHERPLTSMLVAFGIGILIGKLVDR